MNILNHNATDYPDLIEDGNFGSNTFNAVLKNKNPDAVVKYMNAFQGEYYADLAERNKKMEDFTNGWAQRLD
ncbi:putative peptidoglycan-binding domain-containing protein [Arachidicoccus sp.]|uniref:putative peptidoglycan-binding domain-containing protein n=1 Tax=Arachidicoccus sp. TaxID=1872624 RepID=UPI003D1BA2A7